MSARVLENTWPKGHALITNKHNALAQLAIQQIEKHKHRYKCFIFWTLADNKHTSLAQMDEI